MEKCKSMCLNISEKARINPDTMLWYDEYAMDGMNVVTPPSDLWAANAKWDYEEVRALPVGNGRLGAMVYGRTDKEHLQINESTVWSGAPHNYARELESPLTKNSIDSDLADALSDGEVLSSMAEVYGKASELVRDGKTDLATALTDRYFLGDERYQTSYQPFVDLWLDFGHDFDKTENYYRTLDVMNAVAAVSYDYKGTHYERETISSYPDQVIATSITAKGTEKLSFSAELDSNQSYSVEKVSDNEIELKGKVKSSGGMFINTISDAVHFDARVIVDTDGVSEYADGKISVLGATYATVYVLGGTNYIDYKTLAGYDTDEKGNVIIESCNDDAAYSYAAARCEAVKRHISGKSYSDIRSAHIEDYKTLYDNSSVDFSGDSADTAAMLKTTDERIAAFDGCNDLSLVKLYFNYGKYLLISSSRSNDAIESEFDNMLPTGQPSNLQGIWNWKKAPGWGSKYTANINIEMNYFMAETANLSDTQLPLFDALDEIAESGARTAKTQYGARSENAWVLHHNFDIWRGTAPVDLATSGMWPTGGAWLANHMWERYEYTNDESFLRDKAYPILKGSAEFFEEYLKEYSKNGETWLVSPASISPEHGNVQLSPTMDNALIRNILTVSAEAAQILGEDLGKAELWRQLADRIAPYMLNQSGSYLREWLVDGVDEQTGDAEHRHPSQLWGLHPGTDVTPYDNTKEEQEIFDGFINALERRGEGATGWSVAWRACMWARAARGDKAYSQLTSLIKKATAPNLYDMHPDDIFQIDGNLGGAAAIIEMAAQSTDGNITLLPAIPTQWRNGEIKGIKTRGAHELSVKWTDGNAETAQIKAGADGDITVRYVKGTENAVVRDENGAKISAALSEDKQKITFAASEGKTYTISGFTAD